MPERPPVTSGPQITVDTIVYDYGDIKPLVGNKAQFHVSNTGLDELNITNVQGCCGAKVELDKEQLAPGEQTVLSVTYKAPTPGSFKKELYISSNDPQTPRVRLTVKGQVIKTFDAEPRRLKLFLSKENGGCLPLEIKALDGQAFSIKDYQCTGDCIRLDIDPNHSALTYVLQPVVDMNALQAMNPPQGRIQIDLDRPDYDHIMIYFQLIPAFVVTPPQIFIFQADPEKKERRKVTILDNYAADHAQDGNTSAFEIEAITTDGNQVVTVLSQDRLGDGYQLEVEIAPPAPKPGQSSFNGELRIKLKSGEDLKVNLRGFYAQAVMMKAQQEQVSDPEQTQQGQMP